MFISSRYFMTVREASDLVVTSASHAMGANSAGISVYVLNMGQPVRIVDLAERMIKLSGYEPAQDIEIVFTGIRPGERLNEVLFAHDEPAGEIGIIGIVGATPPCPAMNDLRNWLSSLERGLAEEERAAVYRIFQEAVPDFRGAAA